MWFKMQIICLILVAAFGWGYPADNWQVLHQNKSQTLLYSANGVIFIEPGKPVTMAIRPEIQLLKLGQAIYPDGQLLPVDSLQQLTQNLVAQNFRVLQTSYLPPIEEKLRVMLYADTLLSVKFMGTTRTQDFNFLESNLDFLAREFQSKQQAVSKKLSDAAAVPDF